MNDTQRYAVWPDSRSRSRSWRSKSCGNGWSHNLSPPPISMQSKDQWWIMILQDSIQILTVQIFDIRPYSVSYHWQTNFATYEESTDWSSLYFSHFRSVGCSVLSVLTNIKLERPDWQLRQWTANYSWRRWLVAMWLDFVGDNNQVERRTSRHRAGGVWLGQHAADRRTSQPHAFWTGGTNWST